MKKLVDNSWNCLQEADPKKHVLEVSARTENGKVVEVRVRHNDGEEFTAKVLANGENALPMDMKEFTQRFNKDELDIK